MAQVLDSADAETERVPGRRLALLWALVVVGLALHNAEEWMFGLTRWIDDHPWMPGGSLHGDQAQFGLALALVTVAVLATAITAVVSRARWSEAALVSIAYAVIVNAGSHLVMSAASWSLMPGVVSGALVLLPIGLLVTRSLPPMRWTTGSLAITIAAAVLLVLGSLVIAAALSTVLGALR
ncbi:HXXEE domain-containing protein [Brachybacterium sp. FME24]|uniref:HXXEE domain-containing protein n=1 Tax=Brachybacterium sp. FME24 TaxID=2742605 RepID=UPI0018672EC6|nr:HXXEE domain-containing protein [Brachybacterium sp. FME24]